MIAPVAGRPPSAAPGGDALHNEASWQWGGSLNEVALLLFVGLAVG